MVQYVQVKLGNSDTVDVADQVISGLEWVSLTQHATYTQPGRIEMTPEEARELADALLCVADSVESKRAN